MKPPRSILDPEFRWVKPAHTDVGRHLRQWKREQKAALEAERKAREEAERKVVGKIKGAR